MDSELVGNILSRLQAGTVDSELAFLSLSYLFLHSFMLGLILSCLTYLTMGPLVDREKNDKKGKLKIQAILGSSNILFLCVGLTGVMLLVANNLARALAIGATMSLMRFRVKLGSKNLGSNLLFGIIVGVACGLQEIRIAWIVTGIYVILQTGLFFILKKIQQRDEYKVIKTVEAQAEL